MEQRKDYVESQIEMLSRALRKLLEKVLKINTEGNLSEVEKDLIIDSITSTNKISLDALLSLENSILLEMLQVKYGYANIHIKLLGDILFEYGRKINDNINVWNKTKILYQHYQAKEISTIDFIVLSKLSELETKIKAFQN